jgi:hypothetical protein
VIKGGEINLRPEFVGPNCFALHDERNGRIEMKGSDDMPTAAKAAILSFGLSWRAVLGRSSNSSGRVNHHRSFG